MDLPDLALIDLDQRAAQRLAELFAALSDPRRVCILAALIGGERSVSALAEIVGISESGVSHHLRHLRQLRLVRARKVGRQVFYALDDDHVQALLTQGLDHVLHG